MSVAPGRQPTFKPHFTHQRLENSKNNLGNVQSAKNLSLTMSIGANQSSTNFIIFPKPKHEQNYQPVS
jgi:hypothetical protein